MKFELEFTTDKILDNVLGDASYSVTKITLSKDGKTITFLGNLMLLPSKKASEVSAYKGLGRDVRQIFNTLRTSDRVFNLSFDDLLEYLSKIKGANGKRKYPPTLNKSVLKQRFSNSQLQRIKGLSFVESSPKKNLILIHPKSGLKLSPSLFTKS